MATEKISEALEIARRSFQEASNRFDLGNRSLQAKASGSIDLFGGTAISQVAEIVAESRRLCDDLYAACQTQIQLLDETCRPLLHDAIPPVLVRDVWKMICRLNEKSEITNSFTASLNSNQLGDVAAIQYYPSIHCKMVQSYWETKYKNWPGRETFEKEEKIAEQQKTQETQEKTAQKRATAEAEYKQALQAWEKKKREIQQQRNAAVEEGLRQEKPRIEQQIKEKFEKDQNIQKQMREKYLQEKYTAEQACAQLRFYQFIRRKQYEETIAELADKISAAEQALILSERKYREQMQNIEQTVMCNKERWQETANKKFPLPRKPRMPVSMMYANPTPYNIVAEAIKPEIIKTLEKYGKLSYTELSEKCPALTDLTMSRVESYAKALEREGEIRITTKKIDYNIHHFCELAY